MARRDPGKSRLSEARPVPTRFRCLWCGVPIKWRTELRGPGTEIKNYCAKPSCVEAVRKYDEWLAGDRAGVAPDGPLSSAARAAKLCREITDAARLRARERGEEWEGEAVKIRRKPNG